MYAFRPDIFSRLNSWHNDSLIKSLKRANLPKVEVECKIYIPIVIEDELNFGSNLESKIKPTIVNQNLDLPFQLNVKNYD
jgi:hypothetical protein